MIDFYPMTPPFNFLSMYIEVLLGRALPCQDRRHLSIFLLGRKPELELVSKDGTIPPAYGIIYSTSGSLGRSLIISVGIDRLIRYPLRTSLGQLKRKLELTNLGAYAYHVNYDARSCVIDRHRGTGAEETMSGRVGWRSSRMGKEGRRSERTGGQWRSSFWRTRWFESQNAACLYRCAWLRVQSNAERVYRACTDRRELTQNVFPWHSRRKTSVRAICREGCAARRMSTTNYGP